MSKSKRSLDSRKSEFSVREVNSVHACIMNELFGRGARGEGDEGGEGVIVVEDVEVGNGAVLHGEVTPKPGGVREGVQREAGDKNLRRRGGAGEEADLHRERHGAAEEEAMKSGDGGVVGVERGEANEGVLKRVTMEIKRNFHIQYIAIHLKNWTKLMSRHRLGQTPHEQLHIRIYRGAPIASFTCEMHQKLLFP